MKKVILLMMAALLCMASFAQNPEPKQAPKSDTVYVDLSKAKVIVLLDSAKSKQPVKMLNAEAVAKGDVLIGTGQYWYSLLVFMKGSKNGNFTQQETEQLQQPFYEYAAQWEKMLQSRQQQQQK